MYSGRKLYHSKLSEQDFILALASDYLELSYNKQIWQMTDWVELARIWVETNGNASEFISALSNTLVDEQNRYQFLDIKVAASKWVQSNYDEG